MAVGKAIVAFEARDRELQKVSKRSERTLKKFGASAARAAKVAAVAFIAAAAAIGGAVAFFVRAAIQQEDAEVKLAAVLKATGHAAGFTAEQLFAQAAALQKVTTYGDEVIMGTQAILATFKQVKGDTFRRATEAILDMSVVMSQDAKAGAIMLGKALNDPILGVTALTRTGVQFTESQKDMIRSLQESGDLLGAQEIILREVESQFGGAARAAGDTFGGQVQKLKNRLSDVAEKIGTAMIPALKDLMTELELIAAEMEGWDVKAMSQGVMDAVNTVIAGFQELRSVLIGVTYSFGYLLLGWEADLALWIDENDKAALQVQAFFKSLDKSHKDASKLAAEYWGRVGKSAKKGAKDVMDAKKALVPAEGEDEGTKIEKKREKLLEKGEAALRRVRDEYNKLTLTAKEYIEYQVAGLALTKEHAKTLLEFKLGILDTTGRQEIAEKKRAAAAKKIADEERRQMAARVELEGEMAASFERESQARIDAAKEQLRLAEEALAVEKEREHVARWVGLKEMGRQIQAAAAGVRADPGYQTAVDAAKAALRGAIAGEKSQKLLDDIARILADAEMPAAAYGV